MKNNEEVLLSIEHLCQYFRLNHKDFKAVDDVSFNIKKGEVFSKENVLTFNFLYRVP